MDDEDKFIMPNRIFYPTEQIQFNWTVEQSKAHDEMYEKANKHFLGVPMYEPCLESIYAGLGIPSGINERDNK